MDVQTDALNFRTAFWQLKDIGQQLERFINTSVARDPKLKKYLDQDLPDYMKQTQETLS